MKQKLSYVKPVISVMLISSPYCDISILGHTEVNGVKTDCSFNLHQYFFSIYFSIGTSLVSE